MSEAIDIGKRAEYIYKNSYKEIMETQEKRGGRKQNESWTLRVPEATQTPLKMRGRTLA